MLYYRAFGFVKIIWLQRHRAGSFHSFLAIAEKFKDNGFCSVNLCKAVDHRYKIIWSI